MVSGNKSQITILACASAAGNTIPPFVIFDWKNLNQELTTGEIPGTMYGLSLGSGWIDTELFRDWFDWHFLQYAPAGCPLLLLDGHSTHYQPEVVCLAASKGVIMFVLLPHTTHVAQPLNVTCFHSLKTYWDRECNNYIAANLGRWWRSISSQSSSLLHSRELWQGKILCLGLKVWCSPCEQACHCHSRQKSSKEKGSNSCSWSC